jgi:hypothetical protein
MNRLQPQTRQFRERELAKGRTRTRTIRVRVQSTDAFSPRTKARQQTSLICDQASVADTNGSQAVRRLASSTSTIAPETSIDRESPLAMKCPSRLIVVSISPPTSFLVRIRIIRAYAFI